MMGDEFELLKSAFESNWIAPVGPDINAFETEMCDYTGAKYAVAVSSGTAAIHLALMLLGVEQGDEVLCSTFTFAGSAFPICYQGATPVFIDSEEDTWNMDPLLLEKAIEDRINKGKKPKAAILVHLYGQPAKIEQIEETCKRYNIPLIEDAAESVGSFYKGKHTGTIGNFGIFSFNGNKIITTSGGGMLVSNDKINIEKAKFLSTQARNSVPYYEHSFIGYNYRMSNICAAIGRGQLRIIEQKIQKKQEVYNKYRENLSSVDGIKFLPLIQNSRQNFWLTSIIIDRNKISKSPEEIRVMLESNNIESRTLWNPMHLQPIFEKSPAYLTGVSQKLMQSGLSLPSGTNLTYENIDSICNLILNFIQ